MMKKSINTSTMKIQNNDDELFKQIKLHEGCKYYAYQDSEGYLTIGIGRCIDKRIKRPLSEDEVLYLYNNDIKLARSQLSSYPWYQNQDDIRQGVLIELVFNEGLDHLLEFKRMIKALLVKDYQIAVRELVNSNWGNQVGSTRLDDVTYRLYYGKYQ